ncbi:hypothetical protein DS843_06305 [Roseomonas genomospecies 6]|uniref:17 kDa surface antigen n=2 Tax=Roseomonas genomospecies 6 TaxID=214106 RepID=A0A9W7U0M9_9PROT|nr:hypothetical protein DS843_06305 [Roseomonas genomospecies 6]
MFGLPAAVIAGILAGCTPNYSPNTYAASATQQANKVERAVVIGFRQVKISTNGTVGAVTGGAAGGVLGSQSGVFGINSALGAVGGTTIGSLLGTSIEHVTGDTTGWEYIVRKPDGDLLSVTQKDEKPIDIGQKVLVIAGSQARIVADYSVDPEPAPAPAAKEAAKDDAKPTDPVPTDPVVEAKELPPPEPAAVPETGGPAPLRLTPPPVEAAPAEPPPMEPPPATTI